MRTAIIGAGGIAEKAYFPMLSAWQNLDVAGFYSYSQSTVDDVGKRWGFKNGTTDLAKILELEPETVVVISKTSSHYDICRYFLENGVDVYSEKALTDTSAQSFELAEIADKHKRILAVGFNRRYALLCEKAKEIWGDRRIESFIIQKHRTHNNHKTAFRYFLDDAIHQVDFLRYFCGDIEPVACFRENKEDGSYGGAMAVLKIPDGGHAIFSTVITAGAWQENFMVHGGGMSLYLDMFRKLIVRNDDHEVIYGRDRAGSWTNAMLERGFEGEIAHFFECCETRETPKTSGLEAAKTQELMENLIKLTGEEF
jgi:virulence factor